MASLHCRRRNHSNLICAIMGIPRGRSDSHQVENALVAEIHEAAVSTVRSLPNYGNLRGEGLRVTARSSASEGEVLSVVRLFQWLLPGLVANIAFFRAQLR